MRKSRSASHIGNKYTVPIPAIKHDQSPVVGFGYKKVIPNLKLLKYFRCYLAFFSNTSFSSGGI